METTFKDVFSSQNEDEIREWLNIYGKGPKPISPIVQFKYLSEEGKHNFLSPIERSSL